MRKTGTVLVFWNTFIYQTVPELLQPFWQITQRVSSYSFVVIILFGFSVSAGPCDEFPRTPSLTLSQFQLMQDAV